MSLNMSATPPATLPSLADRLARLTPEQRLRLQERLGPSPKAAGPAPLPRRTTTPTLAPLSAAQRRFWFLQSLDLGGHSYNSGAALRIAGPLDEDRLLQALDTVVRRHEALRTVVEPDPAAADAVRQRTLPPQTPQWTRIELSAPSPGHHDAALLEQLRHLRELPFDPSQALSRYALIRVTEREHVLFFCLHHIIADGWSFGVFMRDLQAAYAGTALTELAIQFGDYAAWEAARTAEVSHQTHVAWWVDQLANAPTSLPLPAPTSTQPGTGMRQLALPPDIDGQLRAFASQQPGASPFLVLLSALQAALHRLGREASSTQPDLVIATALAHRDRPELEPVIGNFADVALLRTSVADDPPFASLVQRNRDVLLDAQAHADVALAEVIDALETAAVRQGAPASIGPRRAPAEVLLSFLNVPHPAWDSAGLRYSMVEIPGDQQDFGLYLSFHDNEGGLQGQMSWRRDRFDENTVQALAMAFETLLPTLLAQPTLRLSEPELPRPAWMAPPKQHPDSPAMTAALCAVPGVLDAVLCLRDAGRTTVAYLVIDGSADAARLTALLEAVPPTLRPDTACVVARIPLTPQGAVDTTTLERLPVLLDPLWLLSLEQGHPERAALVVEAQDTLPRLRLAPVLPVPTAAPAPDPASLRGAPALADGGPLQIPAGAPTTLVAALQAVAQARPQRAIHYIGPNPQGAPSEQSYADLLAEAQVRLSGLHQQGLQAGHRAILSFSDLRQHITTFWACVLGGIVPVTVAVAPSYQQHNGVLGKLINTWRHLGRPHVLSTSDVAEALRGLNDWLPDARLNVVAVDTLALDLPAARLHPAMPSDTAFIQLSSGSTGVPKCIAITHTGVVHHVHAAVKASGLSGSDISLNWLPLDHVVPLLTCHLKDVYLGRQQVLVPTDTVLAEPLAWLDLIERYRVTHSWAPNFAFRLVSARLAAEPERHWDLSSIRWLVDAGEQTTAAVLTEFLQLTHRFGLPPAAVHNEFGMAELCTTMTYGAAFDPASTRHRFRKDSLRGCLQEASLETPPAETVSFVPAGRPTPGVRLRIANQQGTTLPEGVIGRLQVQGAVVTPGYIDNPQANAAAFADTGWFDTGDLGFIQDGALTLTGRAKETIIIRGANFYCYEIEDVINALPGVRPSFVACCLADDPSAGTEGLAIFYVPAPEAADPALIQASITTALGSALGLQPNVIVPLEVDEFPKTTSGKIQRSWLAEQLRAGAYAQRLQALHAASEHGGALPNWFSQPVWRPAQSRAESLPGLRTLWVLGGPEALARELVIRWPGPAHSVPADSPTPLSDRLSAQLARHGWPDELVDLTACTTRTARHHLEHLLNLARWLADSPPPAGLRLSIVTQNASWGAGLGPGVPDTEQAVIAPVVAAWALEESCQARCIDLSAQPIHETEALLSEMQQRSTEPVVTLRDKQRWVRRLRATTLPPSTGSPPFAHGVTALITGGLGGIGLELASQMLSHCHARLLLVGRQPEAAVADRLAILKDLPGTVHYICCDVADEAALAASIALAERHWGCQLQLTLHLAGAYHQALWREQPREDLDTLLSAKLAGTRAVLAQLEARLAARAILFSSTIAHTPMAGAGLYAAANAALEACAAAWNACHGARSQVLAWSSWHGLGMSRHSADPALTRTVSGLLSITPFLGWQSLEPVLCSQESHHVIGLDPSHPRVRRSLEGTPLRRQELALATEGRHPPRVLTDRFGTGVAVRSVTVAALPRDTHGAIDRAPLATLLAPTGGAAHRAPTTETEVALAQLWAGLLNTPNIAATDHFFALGGHSLMAVQLVARIREQMGISLTPRSVFESPTLEGLASVLDAELAASDFEEGVL